MDWWPTLFKTKAEPWVFVELDAAQALPELPRREVRAGGEYVHVRLRTMRLPFARKWTTTYHASLTSQVRLARRSGVPAEFLLTTSPAQLRGIGAGDSRRVAMGPTRLAGPVPYRGGGLDLEIGLFAIKDRALAEPYLDFLESLGKVAGVSFIGAAVELIRPLREGLSGVLGLADTTLEAGVVRTLDPLHTGVFAVLATTREELGARRCRLVGDTLSWADGSPVDDVAHVVFSVETSTGRADWSRVPELGAAYDDLIAAAHEDRYSDVQERLARFRRTVALSPDLIKPDADAIFGEATALIHEAFATTGQTVTQRRFPAFGELALFAETAGEAANIDLRPLAEPN